MATGVDFSETLLQDQRMMSEFQSGVCVKGLYAFHGVCCDKQLKEVLQLGACHMDHLEAMMLFIAHHEIVRFHRVGGWQR